MADERARLQQTLDAMKGHRKGCLRVAITSTAEYFVPRIVGGFCDAYPEVDISLEILNRDGVVRRLRQNADDLYLMSMTAAGMQLEQHAFLDNPLVVIAPAGHRLARKRKLLYGDIRGEPFTLREPGAATRRASNTHFERDHFRPKAKLELNSNEAMKQAVAGNLELRVISRHAIAIAPEDEGLAILRLENFPINSKWGRLYPRGKWLSSVTKEFLTYLNNTFAI